MAERDEQAVASQPMKILFICGAGTVSGREVATLNLIEGLRQRGHEVRCVASIWGDGRFQQRLEAAAISHINLPLGFISKTLSWSAVWMTLDQLRRVPHLWLGFRRYKLKLNPDAVIQSNFHHVFLLWPLLNSGDTFFHVHDDFPNSNFYRKLFRFLNLRLRLFICVSRYIAGSIVRLGIPPEKVCSVYNGVAVDELPNGNNDSLPVEPGRGKVSAPVSIGIVGQIGDWKGHDDLIEALKELKQAGLPFSCTIYGEGDPQYVKALMEKIADYDLTAHVRMAGFVKSIRKIYGAIDICVVPSRVHEAFGMVAAEAALFGVPAVATRRGGLQEIVLDGSTGFLVDAEAPEQLAEKLRVLVKDRALREKMGRAARQHAHHNFIRERTAQQVEDILRRAQKPGPAKIKALTTASNIASRENSR